LAGPASPAPEFTGEGAAWKIFREAALMYVKTKHDNYQSHRR